MSAKTIFAAILLAMIAGIVWVAAPPSAAPMGVDVVYRYCREMRDAGKAPLHAGNPGFRVDLDDNGDGTACSALKG